jgi:hypothetical protein
VSLSQPISLLHCLRRFSSILSCALLTGARTWTHPALSAVVVLRFNIGKPTLLNRQRSYSTIRHCSALHTRQDPLFLALGQSILSFHPTFCRFDPFSSLPRCLDFLGSKIHHFCIYPSTCHYPPITNKTYLQRTCIHHASNTVVAVHLNPPHSTSCFLSNLSNIPSLQIGLFSTFLATQFLPAQILPPPNFYLLETVPVHLCHTNLTSSTPTSSPSFQPPPTRLIKPAIHRSLPRLPKPSTPCGAFDPEQEAHCTPIAPTRPIHFLSSVPSTPNPSQPGPYGLLRSAHLPSRASRWTCSIVCALSRSSYQRQIASWRRLGRI